MAGEAAFAGHVAVAADQVAVAVLAVDAVLEGQLMREFHAAAQVELLLGNLVAMRAGAELLVEGLVLEVAEETGGGGHGHVLALHDLAVTTRAAEGLAPPALLQVRRVVEGNAVKIDEAGKQAAFMAAGAEATGVGNLGRGPRAGAGGHVLEQLHQAQHLAADLAAHARREVALDAGHVLVAGLLPRLVVRLHDVATVAEHGPRSIPGRRPGHDHHQEQPCGEQGQERVENAPHLPPERPERGSGRSSR